MLCFSAFEEPSSNQLSRLVAQTDWPCVWTETFLQSNRLGEYPHNRVSHWSDEGSLAALAVGTLNRQFLRSQVAFPTYPRFLDTDPIVVTAFWEELYHYYRSLVGTDPAKLTHSKRPLYKPRSLTS